MRSTDHKPALRKDARKLPRLLADWQKTAIPATGLAGFPQKNCQNREQAIAFDSTTGSVGRIQATGTSINATGTSTFHATGDTTLINPGNNFVDPVNVSGTNVSITDGHSELILGDMTTTETFDATSTGGPITQGFGGVLTIDRPSTFTATNGGVPADIILSNSNNNFGGRVSADGRNIELFDAHGVLQLHNIVASGDFVAASNDGSITQTNEGGIEVTETTTLAATRGGSPADIDLTNKLNNSAGIVNAAGKTVNIDDADSRLQFGKVSAGDKEEMLMNTTKLIVRDTNTRYATEEASSNSGTLNVVQRYGQQWMTRLVQWLANPATPEPVLTEQNVQSVKGEIKIVSGDESKFSHSSGGTSVQ